MIDELRIRGLGVIAEAVVPLGPGLTVLTGETGAGKTMIVTALGMLMGSRPDPSLVRRGAAMASVDATVILDPTGSAAAAVRESGGDVDGDEVVLSRTLPAEGRARAFVGGRPVPAAVLAEVCGELVALHGQSDQLLLRSPARQRTLLDRFAGTRPGADRTLLDRYRNAYRAWRDAVDALESFDAAATEREAERLQLSAGLAAFDAVAPEPGEDERLDEEWARLANVEELRQATDVARTMVGGDDVGAVAGLAQARAAMDAVRGHDPAALALGDRVAELLYLASDLTTDLSAYATGLDADPVRLAEVETRRHDVTRVAKAHGGVGAAIAWAATARGRLEDLGGDDRRSGLVATEAQRRRAMTTLGGTVSKTRVAAAQAFSAAVTAELAALALPRARVVAHVTTGDEPGPEGYDDIEIRLAAHSAADLLPIARAASGGELSRVMLGVEVVVGALDSVSTFVFDEVDAGVGGAAAIGIGRRLARLATTAQVIVVTHLAQVAGYADRHLVVEKADDGSDTVSTVTAVAGPDRVREIARMLGGDAVSDTATAHAAELLAAAAADPEVGRRTASAPAS